MANSRSSGDRGVKTAHDSAAAKRSDQAQQEQGLTRQRGALAWWCKRRPY